MKTKYISSAFLVVFALVLTLLTCCSSLVMKGTPLYTGEYSKPQGPPEDRVNLWPLMYYHKPVMSILWPLGEVTDDHAAVRPLFSVYKLDKERHRYNVLWPLAEFDFDTDNHRIFPFFWGGKNKKYFVAFPELWWFDDFKAVFPLVWWEKGFSVFPLAWYEKNKFCHFFPLWLHRKHEKGYDTHLLWPVFRRQNNYNKQGFRVWPLFGRYRQSSGRRYTYAFWPLCHSFRDDRVNKTTRVAFPLYFRHLYGDDGWRLVVPFIYRQKYGNRRMTLTPLWCAGERGKARWQATLPLYYYSVNPARKTNRWLTPLVGRTQSQDRSRWFVFPLLSSVAWGDDRRDIWMLAPMARFRWGHGNVQNHVFPMYAYNRNRKRILTPLVSWQKRKDEGFVNLLGLLAHYSHEGRDRKAFYLAPPLAGIRWKKGVGCDHARVLPVFSWNRDGQRRSLWIAPWMSFKKSPDIRNNSFFPFWRYSRTLISGKKEGRDINFRVLGWLYNYHVRTGTPEKDTGESEEYVLSSILWYLMHYERENDHKTLDLFPFITYDRNTGEGFRKFSFAWRLIRYERRRDGKLDMDLFFIPIRRGGKEYEKH